MRLVGIYLWLTILVYWLGIYVTLEGGDAIRSVQCYIDDKDLVARLQKGQRLTVYDKCEGLMMNVLMKNCEVVPNLADLEKQ